MRAVVCAEYGTPETLKVEEVPDLHPGPGQVVVKVAAAAVNFPDVLILANKYQVSVPLPFTPGSEMAGTVIAVGDGVTDVAIGDRVFGSVMVGAFAEQVCVRAAGLRPVPEGVDLSTAAATWIAHATAYHALRSVADVAEGETVVVLGAAGGVGLAAVEIALLRGATVIAVASSEDKRQLCLDRGAAFALDPALDLRDGLRAIVPGGVDVVIDPVGGPLAERALRAMRWGGRFVTVGFASGEIPRIPLNLVLLKGVIIKGFEIRTFSENAPDLARRDELELVDLLATGKIQPHISSTYPLDQTADALNEVGGRRSLGKVLVIP